MSALAISEQALMYRSFSGASFAFCFGLDGGGIVIVAVAMADGGGVAVSAKQISDRREYKSDGKQKNGAENKKREGPWGRDGGKRVGKKDAARSTTDRPRQFGSA